MAKLFLTNSLRKQVDRSPTFRRFMMGLEGLLLIVLSWLFRLLSPDLASAAGRRLMTAVGPHLAKDLKIKRNLAIAFPELSRAEVQSLARRVWGNAGAVLGEYPHLGTICDREADQRLQIVVHDTVQTLQRAGAPVVFVSAHLANWEVCAAAGRRLGFPVMVVYTPLANPWMDRLIRRMRQALGVALVARDQAMRPLTQHLKQGGCVGLLVDQRVDSGEPVPFFGADMSTSVMPARLALKFGCALVPVRAERLQGARFRVTAHEPVRPDEDTVDEQAQVLQMTGKVNALFESWIREQPDQWLCTKRRWPKRLTPDWLR